MDKVSVTICIPVYNGKNFIVDTLNAVYNQTYKKINVVILDDCSADDSVDIIQNWLLDKGDNFKFIKNDKNVGLLKCCNFLLSQVDTTYFQLLGHDDIIYPNKILDEVNVLDNSDDSVALVYSNMHVIDRLGNIINKSFFERAEYNGNPPSGSIYNELIKGNFICASSVLCKTKLVKELGGFDEELFFDDWPLWIKLSTTHSIIYLNSVLGAYRVLDNSMIHSDANKQKVAEDTFAMYHNFLKSNYPNKKNFLKLMVKKYAIYCYKLNCNNAKQYLGIALNYSFSIKVFIYYCFSSLGFKSSNSLQK